MIFTTRTPIVVGKSGARVVRFVREDGVSWIEKSGPVAEIAQEAEALRWCENRLPVARILDQQPGVVTMSELSGDALTSLSLDIATTVVADALQQMHSLHVAGCPLVAEWDMRILEAEARLKAGLVDASDFDDENLGRLPESILLELRSFPPLPEQRCFTHGDATLENFLAQDGKLSGIVDLGRAGVTHPAQDWALALRSMRQHFGAEGALKLRAHMPAHCADPTLLRRFCLLDEFF